MRQCAWLVMVCAACAAPREKRGDSEPASPAAPSPAGPLAAFQPRGAPQVEEPYLPPEATWRFLVSRLSMLRADAGAKGEEVLVLFEPGAMHATTKAGTRRTWRWPEGFAVRDVGAQVLLRGDLTFSLFRPDGTELPAAEEVAIVRATTRAPDGGVAEFRLLAKGGREFRTIETRG